MSGEVAGGRSTTVGGGIGTVGVDRGVKRSREEVEQEARTKGAKGG